MWLGKAVNQINGYWDEAVPPLRRSVITGVSFLFGLLLIHKIIIIIAVIIIFSQRIIYNANAVEKTEKVIKKTIMNFEKDERNNE